MVCWARSSISVRIAEWSRSLAPFLALEVGAGQAAAVASLMTAAGFADADVRRDLAGIERVVVGRR